MLPVALFALVGFTTLVYSRAKLHLLTTLHQFGHLASAVRDYSAGRAGSKVGVCLGLTPVLGSPLHLPPLQFLTLQRNFAVELRYLARQLLCLLVKT